MRILNLEDLSKAAWVFWGQRRGGLRPWSEWGAREARPHREPPRPGQKRAGQLVVTVNAKLQRTCGDGYATEGTTSVEGKGFEVGQTWSYQTV